MRIDVVTVHPELLSGPFSHSILKRAKDRGLAEVVVHDLREYGLGKHQQVDDYQFGGGAGMVMMIEPIDALITKLRNERDYDEVIFMTPDGDVFDQPMANWLSLKGNLIILCGHYKGIDHRVREHLVSMEVSIGDFVLTGGELPAAMVCDAVIRLIPGVMNDETSALTDSFQDGLLAPPVYTRPADYKGWKVPEVLLSGHEKKITEWRETQAYERTRLRRPGLLGD